MNNITKLKLLDGTVYNMSAPILLDQTESNSTTSAPSSNYIKEIVQNINNSISNINNSISELNSDIKIIIREPVISSASEAYGGYCSLGDIVMTTLRLKVLTSVPGYTRQISVPAPKYGSFTVYDSNNTDRFQINDSGVFQNVATLEAGDYTVFAIYIK